jgi:hypothetical protein
VSTGDALATLDNPADALAQANTVAPESLSPEFIEALLHLQTGMASAGREYTFAELLQLFAPSATAGRERGTDLPALLAAPLRPVFPAEPPPRAPFMGIVPRDDEPVDAPPSSVRDHLP